MKFVKTSLHDEQSMKIFKYIRIFSYMEENVQNFLNKWQHSKKPTKKYNLRENLSSNMNLLLKM